MIIGKKIRQPQGYEAFIPEAQLVKKKFDFPPEILAKAAKAERLIGKLDGVTHNLPDADFFLSMYIVKDATHSSQIEGTRATMMDALELKMGVNLVETDASDILYYIKALNYGIERIRNFPFSLRFIRELHQQLMEGARSSHFSDPGEFRRSQNWISGTSPANAVYVPPPVEEMHKALNDLEEFINSDKLMPIIHAGLLHAQFETIHPFLDGNGRTGRLMITLFLYERAILEKPVLFLSSYFKKHQQLYYTRLNDYHNNNIMAWLHFFLDGVIETATQSIELSKNILALREKDMRTIQALGKREADSGVRFLMQLYKTPVVTSGIVAGTMGFSRAGALKLIDRFVQLKILEQKEESVKYGKTYVYRKYVNIFAD